MLKYLWMACDIRDLLKNDNCCELVIFGYELINGSYYFLHSHKFFEVFKKDTKPKKLYG